MRFFIYILAIWVWLFAPVYAQMREGVVLLHGFIGNEEEMADLEDRLQIEGYKTVNTTYPTTIKSIAEMANEVIPAAMAQLGDVDHIHFVTHSMGGILFRSYSERHDISSVSRVVMLAPPNHGSEVAGQLSKYEAYRRFFGPAAQELVQINLKPQKIGDYELGIIAGSASLNPIFSPILPGKDDGWVSLASTPLLGMNDFIVIPTSHGFITKNESAIEETVIFLRTGKFDHDMELKGMPINTESIFNFNGSSASRWRWK